MKSFKGKVAVVTGGGGTGIGNALVRAFASEGAHVAYCDIANLNKTEKDIEAFVVKKYAEHVDIADKEAIKRFADNVLKEFGHIDVLINNAGIATGDISFDKVTEADFERITNINYWGVIRTTQAFYHHLLTRPEAAIANISSTQGILAAPYLVSYCTTKFAVRGFTDSLRVENQVRGIKNLSIHTVHPGAVATNITLSADHQGPRSQHFHKVLQEKGASPAEAAKIILKGIRKNKSRIFISDGRAQDIIARLFPSSLHKIIGLMMKMQGAEIT